MKQDEYIKTIVYNSHMINIGLDDYGQTYFLEYVEDGELKEECVGAYVTDYENYIEWRFGEPEINCPIYRTVVTTDKERCAIPYRPFCLKCRKRWNDNDYAAWQKRNEEFAKWLEENNNGKSI
jgi:hypothetical protein